MSKITRWGIVGPGNIAHKFAKGLKALEDAKLYAVVSRSQDKADAFGAEYDVEKCYGDMEGFLADDLIDAVYIATPHPFHKDYAMRCMDAGMAVLCEKPVAMNNNELSEMIECAIRNDVFFMEAVWTRFLPLIVRLRELLSQNIIGEVKRVVADFAFSNGGKKGRLYEPALGGGGLLDVGIYVINFTTMVLGNKPSKVVSIPFMGQTGVDERAGMILGYENGVMANLYCGVSAQMKNDAVIYGEKGYITIHEFWQAQKMVITYFDEAEDEVIELDHRINGYSYEAEAVQECMAKGLKESDTMPLDDSVAVMQIMDDLRKDWGLKYPME